MSLPCLVRQRLLHKVLCVCVCELILKMFEIKVYSTNICLLPKYKQRQFCYPLIKYLQMPLKSLFVLPTYARSYEHVVLEWMEDKSSTSKGIASIRTFALNVSVTLKIKTRLPKTFGFRAHANRNARFVVFVVKHPTHVFRNFFVGLFKTANICAHFACLRQLARQQTHTHIQHILPTEPNMPGQTIVDDVEVSRIF